ncbi:hypothetical protein [Paracraurococcus lichenis]|uniref:Lipoprotein n=1 Tax=Paracraurococcus lichenis TaxID=3064888 RepID=A0ABT9DYA3_9PROT|nr:hypothetical protein [Paracraurococcus sp. LOR1-02]MDO9708887.1 hypothetical protein [Paracraurococcus sp. LOR1-02]
MKFTCRLGGLALVVLGLAACEPSSQSGPLSTMPTGTNESLLRQQQLRNAQQDPSRAMQNPTVTNVSPGAAGIERAQTGGAGGTGAGAPVSVSPGAGGIERAPGIGAPTR